MSISYRHTRELKISAKGNCPMRTLRTHDNNCPVVACFPDDGKEGIPISGNIPCTEGFNHDAFQFFRHDGLEKVELDAGENLNDANGNVF